MVCSFSSLVKSENPELNTRVKSESYLCDIPGRVEGGGQGWGELYQQTFIKHIGFSLSEPTLMLTKWAIQELGLGVQWPSMYNMLVPRPQHLKDPEAVWFCFQMGKSSDSQRFLGEGSFLCGINFPVAKSG